MKLHRYLWAFSMAFLTFLTGTGMSFIIVQPLTYSPSDLAIISHPAPKFISTPQKTVTPMPTVMVTMPPTATVVPTATPHPANTATQPTQPTATPINYVSSGPNPIGNSTIPSQGQVILVSLAQQWLWAYRDGRMVYDTPVTTGSPQLPTPDGTYHVLYEQHNLWFNSPWPQNSPYYYAPEFVHYALYYHNTGFYIHDAPWRQQFGPGTNYTHTDPNGTTMTGSHGCVEVPTVAGSWLYSFAHAYTTIVIYGTAPVDSPQPTTTATAQPTATPQPTATMIISPTIPATP